MLSEYLTNDFQTVFFYAGNQLNLQSHKTEDCLLSRSPNKCSSIAYESKTITQIQHYNTSESHDLFNVTILDVSCDDNSESPRPRNHPGHLCSSSRTKKPNVWGVQSRILLHGYIKENFHKVVDFMFVAIEADISLNTDFEECIICRELTSVYGGITFPYCSYWFCWTCLTKPSVSCHTMCTNDFVLLYSNSTIQNKTCAIILDEEIWGSLLDFKRFVPEKAIMTSDTNDDIVPNQSSSYLEDLENNNLDKNVNAENFSLISSTKVIYASNLINTLSEVVLFRNSNPSVCFMCYRSILVTQGVILRTCFHVFCDCCLIDKIMETLDYSVEVRCPLILKDQRRCNTIIQEREIKSLLTPEQYEKYDRKCLDTAQQEFESSARCFKPNCNVWVILDGYKESFYCPVCGNENCLLCKKIHHGESCKGEHEV